MKKGYLFTLALLAGFAVAITVAFASGSNSTSTKRAGAADADLALETSGENMARALKVMSAKSAKRIGR